MTPHIRPAAPADAAEMARIYNDAVLNSTATFDTQPESVEARIAWLERHATPRHPALIAELDGRVIGWGALSEISDRCAYEATAETSVYIHAGFTGRGIGRALSEALLDAGRRGGVHSVIARVCTENVASLAMCASLGFTEVGVMHEVGYKFGRYLDVATFELLLKPAGDART
jgi:L-amino acid N-acyltransferase